MNTSTSASKVRQKMQGLILGLLLAAATGTTALAQETIVHPNYREADLRQIIEAVSDVTGKNFIIDPRVNAKVTMISNSPMTPDAFYEAFLAILQVHAYIAVPSGDLIKIVPDANARQLPGNDLPARIGNGRDEIVTQVVQVQNINAAQLVPILRPLIPQYGHLAAYPASNMLIISDRAANVTRLLRIIRRIDQTGDEEIEVIPLEHASAGETVRVMTTLLQGTVRADTVGGPVTFVADARTNSVLISGDKANRLRYRTLIAHLDTPLEQGGNTRVRYLRYADATELAEKLKEHVQLYDEAPQGGGAAGAAGPRAANVTIWGDAMTNALVIHAPTKVMREIMSVVDRLDIRRAQVAVEAIIVEVSADLAAEFGFTWAVFDPGYFAGISNFRTGGLGLADIIGAAIDGDLSSDDVNIVPDGLTAGGADVSETGTSWALLVRALAGDANTNIISTPSIVTMDNEEAEIKIAQEIPFLTGSFTNTGAAGTAVNPFQTIQRQEVGTILKITPQINEGSAINLAINQEQSSLAASSEGAVDLITNKRTITTNVIVEDGGMVVLGGLIESRLLETEQRVPILGSIPLFGQLFKTRSTDLVKNNLMVFIQVTILRNAEDTAFETNQKYQYMRDLQLPTAAQEVQLMPNETRPTLEEKVIEAPPASGTDDGSSKDGKSNSN